MDERQHKKALKREMLAEKIFFTKMVREKLIMAKFWKSLKSALSKFLKLKKINS